MVVWIANVEAALRELAFIGRPERFETAPVAFSSDTHFLAFQLRQSAMNHSSHETAGQKCEDYDPDKERCIQEGPSGLRFQLVHYV